MDSQTMNRPTILVADDDPQVRQALRVRLESLEYDVVECRDGLDAIAKTRGTRVDALVLDHEMPLGEGRSIADNIRRYTKAPIIFLSGRPREEFKDTVMRLSGAYFLPKPLDGGKLQTLLSSLIGKPHQTAC